MYDKIYEATPQNIGDIGNFLRPFGYTILGLEDFHELEFNTKFNSYVSTGNCNKIFHKNKENLLYITLSYGEWAIITFSENNKKYIIISTKVVIIRELNQMHKIYEKFKSYKKTFEYLYF